MNKVEIRLNKEKDKDLIEFLATCWNKTYIIKLALRQYIQGLKEK